MNAQERWQKALVPNYGTPDLCLVEGKGSRVTDDDGRTYLDLLAGVAVNVLGHAHPEVVAAAQDQLGRLVHTSNLYSHPRALELAERLQKLTGGHKALLVNSGTEANEAALKLVRKRAHDAGRHDAVVLAFQGSFHGRTLGGLSLTGQPKHQAGFAPLPGGVVQVPFNDPAALEAAFDQHDVAGVFVEGVQGEGGVRPLDGDTAAVVGRRTGDALLCFDEVQTGVARTGRFFSYEHHGLRPDVVTLAKGLGGGLPIGACLVTPEHADVLGPGSHGCTFGGNPVAAAAALAVLDVVERDGLARRAGTLGQQALDVLGEAGFEARGMGLLLGLPVENDRAPQVARSLRDQGILVGQAGAGVVRLAPPLNVPERPFLDAVGKLAKAARPLAA